MIIIILLIKVQVQSVKELEDPANGVQSLYRSPLLIHSSVLQHQELFFQMKDNVNQNTIEDICTMILIYLYFGQKCA